jgi:hypothetical protein
VNDLREEHDETEYDLTCVNFDFVSNEIDESELQDDKRYEQST